MEFPLSVVFRKGEEGVKLFVFVMFSYCRHLLNGLVVVVMVRRFASGITVRDGNLTVMR